MLQFIPCDSEQFDVEAVALCPSDAPGTKLHRSSAARHLQHRPPTPGPRLAETRHQHPPQTDAIPRSTHRIRRNTASSKTPFAHQNLLHDVSGRGCSHNTAAHDGTSRSAAVTHVRSDRSRTAARRSRMSLDIRSGGRISPRIPARPGSSRSTVSSSVIAMDVILCPPHSDDGTGRGRSMTLANEIGEKDVASKRGTLEGNLGGESSNCSAVDGTDPAAVRSAPGNTCSV